MTIGKELAAFRADCPDCATVVFADMETGLVLAHDAAERTTQEKLDQLCEALREGRSDPFYLALRGLECTPATAAPDVFWQAAPAGTMCFVGNPQAAGEALCLLIVRDEALNDVSSKAVTLWHRLVAEA